MALLFYRDSMKSGVTKVQDRKPIVDEKGKPKLGKDGKPEYQIGYRLLEPNHKSQTAREAKTAGPHRGL